MEKVKSKRKEMSQRKAYGEVNKDEEESTF